MRVEGRGGDYGVIHLRVEASENLIEFIAREAAIDLARARELVELGAVYMDDKRSLENLVVKAGDHVRVHSSPRRYKLPQIKIVFQNNDFIIVDKASGVPVHALTDNLRENLLAQIEGELGSQVFITHRLDIETSGLLVIAKTQESQREINRKIASKSIKRIYTALVRETLEVGKYIHFMEASPTAPKTVSREAKMGWQECRLRVLECVKSEDGRIGEHLFPVPAHALKIELLTGRTQQIRAQLAALGRPILGDVTYGGPEGFLNKVIALRASSIEIDGCRYTVD